MYRPLILAAKRLNSFQVPSFSIFQHRNYAKSKRPKKSRASQRAQPQPDTDTDEFDYQKYYDRMDECIGKLRDELTTLRTGHADPGILTRLRVPIDGYQVTLDQLSQIFTKDPQNLNVISLDVQHTNLIEKAIRNSGLNLNPIKTDDNILQVPIPKLSLEHRNNLLKQLGQMAEKSKISIRHHRQHARNKLKTFAKSMEQRQIRRLEQMIDNKANENSKIVDDMMKLKAKNIKPK